MKRRSRPKRRTRRTRTPRRRSNFQSMLRTATTALRGINTTRTLSFVPKIASEKSQGTSSTPGPSWLESAFPYIIAAMKFFGTILLTSDSVDAESKVVIQSCSQTILISIDDILYKHPIVTPSSTKVDSKDMEIMSINYSMGKLTNLKVVISLMGNVASRAGRIVAAIEPLIREKALQLRSDASGVAKDEERSFEQITQLPGSIVSPNLRPITINLRPTGFASQWVEVGQADLKDNVYPKGGMPLFLLFVGYQDLASNSSDPNLAYSLEEASLCIEISGTIELKAPVTNKRFMRSIVKTLATTTAIKCQCDGKDGPSSVEIPLHHVQCIEGSWIHRPELDDFDTLID